MQNPLPRTFFTSSRCNDRSHRTCIYARYSIAQTTRNSQESKLIKKRFFSFPPMPLFLHSSSSGQVQRDHRKKNKEVDGTSKLKITQNSPSSNFILSQ